MIFPEEFVSLIKELRINQNRRQDVYNNYLQHSDPSSVNYQLGLDLLDMEEAWSNRLKLQLGSFVYNAVQTWGDEELKQLAQTFTLTDRDFKKIKNGF